VHCTQAQAAAELQKEQDQEAAAASAGAAAAATVSANTSPICTNVAAIGASMAAVSANMAAISANMAVVLTFVLNERCPLSRVNPPPPLLVPTLDVSATVWSIRANEESVHVWIKRRERRALPRRRI
jgi:hypothetical protein